MVHFLVSVPANQTVERLNLTLGGSVCYFPDFLDPEDHLSLLQHLIKDIDWAKFSGYVYDKFVKFPRLNANMSDPDFESKTYWQDNLGTWTKPVHRIREKLQRLTGRKFSYAHLGYYQTGENYLGYHSDRELVDGDIICSVSFGATRRFILRERYLKNGKIRKSGPPNYEFFLKGGSLFIFDQLAARDCYKHSVPIVRKLDNYTDEYGVGRINITFREK